MSAPKKKRAKKRKSKPKPKPEEQPPPYRRLRDVTLDACPHCPGERIEWATENETPSGARYFSIRHSNGRICHYYPPQ